MTRRLPVTPADWWPPKIGDKLRGIWGPVDNGEDPLYHVIAVFAGKDGHSRIVTAELLKSGRWDYSVHHAYESEIGSLRLDGSPRKT
jgi:hypothetical protein